VPTLVPPIGVSLPSTSIALPESIENDLSESDSENIDDFGENDFVLDTHSLNSENLASDGPSPNLTLEQWRGSPMVLPQIYPWFLLVET
jgi:hypothetical protein